MTHLTRVSWPVVVAAMQSKLVSVTVRSLAGGSCRLRYGDLTRDLNPAKGRSAQWDGAE